MSSRTLFSVIPYISPQIMDVITEKKEKKTHFIKQKIAVVRI